MNAATYLWSNPPSCLAEFQLVAIKPERGSAQSPTVFGLGCTCGSRHGSIMGYPLKDVKEGCSTRDTFVGPLAFVCSSCERAIEIINTDVHGYHGALKKYLGESTSPATIRGEGRRRVFECPKCTCIQMAVCVRFRYSGAEQDVEEDHQTGHMEDFFLGFYAVGLCVGCGEKCDIADFTHL